MNVYLYQCKQCEKQTCTCRSFEHTPSSVHVHGCQLRVHVRTRAHTQKRLENSSQTYLFCVWHCILLVSCASVVFSMVMKDSRVFAVVEWSGTPRRDGQAWTLHNIPSSTSGFLHPNCHTTQSLENVNKSMKPVVKTESYSEKPAVGKDGSVSFGRVLSTSSKILLCDLCSASFSAESSRKRHMLAVHLKKALHRCLICGKGFAIKEYFRDHMNTHNNVPAYKCPNCPKAFAYRTSFRRHCRENSCAGTKVTSQ